MDQKAAIAESNNAKVQKAVNYLLRTKLRPMEQDKASGEVRLTVGVSNGGISRLLIETSEVARDGAK